MDRERQEGQNIQTGVADCNQAIETTWNDFCSWVWRILDADDIDVQLQTAFSP